MSCPKPGICPTNREGFIQFKLLFTKDLCHQKFILGKRYNVTLCYYNILSVDVNQGIGIPCICEIKN